MHDRSCTNIAGKGGRGEVIKSWGSYKGMNWSYFRGGCKGKAMVSTVGLSVPTLADCGL